MGLLKVLETIQGEIRSEAATVKKSNLNFTLQKSCDKWFFSTIAGKNHRDGKEMCS